MAPVEGHVALNGREVRRPGPDRMMVFQEFDQLLPWKTVKQNIMFPMLASGKYSRAEAAERADLYIGKVNLFRARDSYPHTLSGGMKQRVAIARGMAMEPDILLMDEPFAALDSLTRGQMQDELLALWEETRCTLLFVTHSISEATKIGNRILLMSAHPGRVRAEINQVAGRGKALESEIYGLLFGSEAGHEE
jgi:NitT/TauT family transport system ATP-binding protein